MIRNCTVVTDALNCPGFSDAYHGTRKAYGLSSALLIAWEFIGIEVQEVPIVSLNLKLKSPEAIPYVLIALTIYFGFRFSVEWFQSSPLRRGVPASRVDFAVAHILGVLSLGLFLLQRWLDVQVADYVATTEGALFGSGFLVSFGTDLVGGLMLAIKSRRINLLLLTATLVTLGLIVAKIVQVAALGGVLVFLTGLGVGGLPSIFLFLFVATFRRGAGKDARTTPCT